MRITNTMIMRGQLASLRAGTSALDRAQQRATTGLRLQRASDDPAGAGDVMGAGGSLRAIDQYRRNVGNAGSRLAAEEPVLDSLGSLIVRAKELAITQSTFSATQTTRDTAVAELEELVNHAIALANTKFGDEFLFGGQQVQTVPFTATRDAQGRLDFTHTSPAGSRAIEITSGQRFVATHDGTEAFLDTGALAALRDMANALRAGDETGIAMTMNALDTAHNAVQVLVGEMGARQSKLQVTTANLDALETGLRTFRSDIEEVDFEAAVTELVTRQTAYQSALLATSKVLNLNITDYLR